MASQGVLRNSKVAVDFIFPGQHESKLVSDRARCSRMPEVSTVDDFVSILQKCRQTKNLVQAKCLHAYMREMNVENHPVLGNYLVSMLIDCGDLFEAGRVFDRLPCRSQYSWSSLIAGFVSYGEYDHAFRLYQKMQEEGLQTKNFTFRAMMKGCSEMKDAKVGQIIHASIVEEGLDEDSFIGSTVVDMYGKCGFMEEARGAFDKLKSHDEVLWTVLISGYADQGHVEEVWSCLENMQLKGVCPDASTFVCSLKACAIDHNPEAGHKMHTEIIFKGLEQDLYVSHMLVDLYAKCGLLLEAQGLFQSSSVQSIIPWTALIVGYTDIGLAEEALGCLEQMGKDGICPTYVTFVCALKACSTIGALHAGQELHLDVLKKGLDIDLFVSSTLIDMYAKCGSLLESWTVLNALQVRGPVAWNALLAGYVSHGLYDEAMNSFEKMQQEGVSPVVVTFIHTLKACAEERALTTGQVLHDKMIKRGWEGNLDISNSLVDFYGKCGHYLEARMLFDLLPVCSCVSWTALVSGYLENGLGHEALNCFMQMQTEAIYLDKVAFAYRLKACIMLEAFEVGCILHALAGNRGWEKEHIIGSMLLSMYARYGLLPEAQKVFNSLQVQSVETWTLLIVGYLQHGDGKTAVEYLHVMQQQGFSPTTESLASMLKVSSILRVLGRGQFLHTEITKRGLEKDFDVEKLLVDVYSKCGMLLEARHSLKRIAVKDSVCWTSFIMACTELGLGNEAIDNINQMMLESICPIASTFVFGFKACGLVGTLKAGQQLHAEVLKRGWERDVYIGTALVDMLAKCRSFAEARYWMLRFPSQISAAWNALIGGYADHYLGEEALDCFAEMQLNKVYPVGVTYTCVLKVCGLVEAVETGLEVHSEVLKRGLEGDSLLGTALVDMYSKCGKLEEAQKTFNKCCLQDVAAWNALIKGSGENHECIRALQCSEIMRAQGVNPNAITYIVLLAVCSDSSMVTEGHEYFEQMIKQGIKPTLDHCTCMVDLFARAGRIDEAEEFAKAHNCLQTSEVLRALLTACKIHCEVVLGEKFFAQILTFDEGDAAAYMLMADIYIGAGRWTDAERVEAARINAAATKMPAKATIQLNKKLYEYIVGGERSKEVAERLDALSARMRRAGYMPYLDVVVKPRPDLIDETRS